MMPPTNAGSRRHLARSPVHNILDGCGAFLWASPDVDTTVAVGSDQQNEEGKKKKTRKTKRQSCYSYSSICYCLAEGV